MLRGKRPVNKRERERENCGHEGASGYPERGGERVYGELVKMGLRVC